MQHVVALLATCLCFASTVSAIPAVANYSVYHTKDEVFQTVHDIVGTQQQPKSLAITTETKADGNYSSQMTVVNVEMGGLAGGDATKIRMLLNFGQHGRELITSEVAVRLLALLASDAQLVKFCALQSIPAARLLASLKHVAMKVVPMENVRGRERVEAGEACLRKNGRGVDTNRNWAVHWGHKERDYDPEEEYPGDRPFSEPEAEMLRALAASWKPHVWVNVHSGMEALFMPYDHRAEVPEGPGPTAALAILQELNRTACGGRCAVGSGGKAVGYLAHGTATDYMFEELHVPMPFTWEIYGDEGASCKQLLNRLLAHFAPEHDDNPALENLWWHAAAGYAECFRMFNPSSEAEVAAVVDAWAGAFLRLVLLLPMHPDIVQDVPAMATAGQQLSAEHAAVGANQTLATADEEVVKSGGSAPSIQQVAVGTAKHHEAGNGWVITLAGSVSRTIFLCALAAGSLAVLLVLRRRVWRRLAARGRANVRTRRQTALPL